jgi:6-pyruvoyltetrahydropterin/6-carboxytetrahydropterin synthase
MLILIKRFEFEAAHRLPKHPGKCKYLHGHRYELEVGVTGPLNPDTGMIADFKALKDLVHDMIIDRLDHACLNELDKMSGFPASNPTAEEMVFWMVAQLNKQVTITGCTLAFLRLWETSGSWVEWRP